MTPKRALYQEPQHIRRRSRFPRRTTTQNTHIFTHASQTNTPPPQTIQFPLLPTTNPSSSTLIQLIQQPRTRNQLSNILPLKQLKQIAREQLLLLTRVVLAALVALVSVLLALVAVLPTFVPVVRLEPVVLRSARLDARMAGAVVRVLGTVVVQSVLGPVVRVGVLGTVVRVVGVLRAVVEAVRVVRVRRRAVVCAVFACHELEGVVPAIPMLVSSFCWVGVEMLTRRDAGALRIYSNPISESKCMVQERRAYGAARTGATDAAATRTVTSFVEKSILVS